jgi:hypothetical protein
MNEEKNDLVDQIKKKTEIIIISRLWIVQPAAKLQCRPNQLNRLLKRAKAEFDILIDLNFVTYILNVPIASKTKSKTPKQIIHLP